MGDNPFLGVAFHWIGGLAAASFYLPYKAVRRWSWETYWLVGGVFSWLLAPSVLAVALVPDVAEILRAAPAIALLWAYVFGVLWGIGGLTFGLSMRYLGIALGYAIALGLCTVFGTLMPPIFEGKFGALLREPSGRFVLLGMVVCLGGFAVSALAGSRKERELTADEKAATSAEFHFARGLAVATLSGVMSACFAYGLAAGKPIGALAKARLLAAGRPDLWQNLPVLIVVLWGGFTTNVVWCLWLNRRNRSGGEYLALAPAPEGESGSPASLPANYAWCALAGVTWYLQFFFYSMGQTKMGRFDFSSWTLHMASIIIFSTLWGIALHEWRGTSHRTRSLVVGGLLLLIGSTLVVGYGNYLKSLAPG
jgi:L-rhamnose-H+ transport protein